MIIKSIYNIAKSFDKKDWTEFGKFVRSPYFVSGNINKILFNRIKLIFGNKRRKKELTADIFVKFLFETKELKNAAKQTLNNRLSVFLKVMEEYLIIKNGNDFERKSKLLAEYFSRNLQFEMERNLKQVKKSINENSFADEYYYIQKIYSLDSEYLLSQKNNPMAFQAFQMQTNFHLADFLEKLFYYNLEFYLEEFYGNKPERNIYEILYKQINKSNLIEEIKNRKSRIYYKVLIRYYLFNLFKENNWEQFHREINILFFGNETKFSRKFRLSVYSFLESFYTSKINLGDSKFVRIMFDLMKRREKNNLMPDFSKGLFSMNIFNNFITIGLKVSEYKWVDEFIEKYSPALPKEIKDNEYCLNKARLLFSMKEYKKALEHLAKAENTVYDKYHFLHSRLRLQVFYELSMTDEAYNEIDKLKHKLRNSKVSPEEAKRYTKDFINIYLSFLKARDNANIETINNIEYNIKSTKNIISKDWFLQKLTEMKETSKKPGTDQIK